MPSKASIRNCATSLERMKTVKVTNFFKPSPPGHSSLKMSAAMSAEEDVRSTGVPHLWHHSVL